MKTTSAEKIHYLACPVAQAFIDRNDTSVKLAIDIAQKLQNGTYNVGENKDPNTVTFGGYFADCSWLRDGDDWYNDKPFPDMFFIHCNRSPQYDGCPVFFVSQYPYQSGEEFENAIKDAKPLQLP